MIDLVLYNALDVKFLLEAFDYFALKYINFFLFSGRTESYEISPEAKF